jgi:hypothetical protein
MAALPPHPEGATIAPISDGGLFRALLAAMLLFVSANTVNTSTGKHVRKARTRSTSAVIMRSFDLAVVLDAPT